MKANEAPKRIWINSPQDLPCSSVDNNSIEYTRTDAFIEKACEWIKKRWSETDYRFHEDFTGMLVDDFKKHMKGE
jgi:hypothetical protein